MKIELAKNEVKESLKLKKSKSLSNSEVKEAVEEILEYLFGDKLDSVSKK